MVPITTTKDDEYNYEGGECVCWEREPELFRMSADEARAIGIRVPASITGGVLVTRYADGTREWEVAE
jgi:hypothetical protein